MEQNNNHQYVTYHRPFIFSGRHSVIVPEIVKHLNALWRKQTPLGIEYKELDPYTTKNSTQYKMFADGDFKWYENISVADGDIYIIAQCRQEENLRAQDILEVASFAFSLKGGRADHITVIFPKCPFDRQDKEKEEREPILIEWFVRVMKASGVDRIVMLEIHNPASIGADSWGMKNVQTRDFLLKKMDKENCLDIADWSRVKFMAPDRNAANYVGYFADHFGCEVIIANKERDKDGNSKPTHIIGDPAGYEIVLVDDIFDSCKTIADAAIAAKERGAIAVSAVGTHPVLTRNWKENIKRADFKRIVVTDTCLLPKDFLLEFSEARVLTVAKLLAGVVDNLHNSKSVTEFAKVKEMAL